MHGGTFAEYVSAPVRTLAPKPSSLSFEEAAAVPLAGLTAYQSIQRSGVSAGQTVLVHAAARVASAGSPCRSPARSARPSSAPRRSRTTSTCAVSAPSR